MKKLLIILVAMLLPIAFLNSYAGTVPSSEYIKEGFKLHPITWKGKKWEYLVEYPRDIQHIDPTRFEEILDDAGQHGWELITVSHEAHFYVFYFKRELLPHKIAAHREHLKNLKAIRKKEYDEKMALIMKAHEEKMRRQQAAQSQ